MPHSSTPIQTEADDDSGMGTLLTSGGGNVTDAARQAQLEAMERARSEAIAKRQLAIEEGAREYARQQQAEEDRRRELLTKREQQREAAETTAFSFIIACVTCILAYMAYNSVVTTSTAVRSISEHASFS